MELKEFQCQNCSDCYFADKPKVGTGEPCCTYPGKLSSGEYDKGICYSWKPDAQTNARLQKARKLMNQVISRL